MNLRNFIILWLWIVWLGGIDEMNKEIINMVSGEGYNVIRSVGKVVYFDRIE